MLTGGSGMTPGAARRRLRGAPTVPRSARLCRVKEQSRGKVPEAVMRVPHLGAWTLFADIAGQVSARPQNPIVTAAAVAVPSDLVGLTRTRLRQRFEGQP